MQQSRQRQDNDNDMNKRQTGRKEIKARARIAFYNDFFTALSAVSSLLHL
jgi:hypothetical protein